MDGIKVIKNRLSLQRSGALLLSYAMNTFFPDRFLVETRINEEGFYSDFLWNEPPLEGFLFTLQEKMESFKRSDLAFEEMSMMRTNAIQFFLSNKQEHLISRLETLEDTVVTFSKIANFYEIQDGELLSNPSDVKEILLYSMNRAFFYYHNLGTQSVLRIHGACFMERKEKQAFSKKLEFTKKHSAKTFATKLNLFSLNEDVTWLSRGIFVRDRLTELLKREYLNLGFEQVETSNYVNSRLKRHKLSPIEERYDCDIPSYVYEEDEYVFSYERSKAHTALFLASQKSGKSSDKNKSYVEYLKKEQFVLSKELDDLFVTRTCYGDISHIFLKEEDLRETFRSSLKSIQKIVNILGLKCSLSYILPDKVSHQIKDAMDDAKQIWDGEIVTRKDNGSDPKFEICARDLLGRNWPISAVGFDSAISSHLKNQPQKEIAKDYSYVISQSLYLSIERLLAILLEKDSGLLPPWMNSEQIRILTSDESQTIYSENILNKFRSCGLLATLDNRKISLSSKTDDCKEQKIPIFVVIGKKEVQCNTISVCILHEGDRILSIEPEDILPDLIKICSMPG